MSTGVLKARVAGAWVPVSAGSGGGTGNVLGPDVSVINRVATYADATGKLIKDSGVLITDLLKVTGGFPGGSTTFLRADGTFAALPAGLDEVFVGTADPGAA